jgi:carbonic anhydrase/acetyltransferase-like protein (isoleucine patch superfamily)
MSVEPFANCFPSVGANCFVAENAVVIGDVHIGALSSVWFGAIVRGDVNFIRIGSRTNIQDGSLIHVTRKTFPTHIGDGVTVGHRAMLHGCTLMDGSFVGMSATVMDGAVVESGGWLAAGALLAPAKRVPPGEIWAGVPAKFLRYLTREEAEYIQASSDNYVALANEYRAASRTGNLG